ncbi:MAG: rane protein [Thermoleophilaceae bacterium]|nr:rane protein [Thermoleophilaceae bacterium]
MPRRIAHFIALFWKKAYEDNLTGLSGMVAYNLLLSILPVTLLALFIAGRVLSSPGLEDQVVTDLKQLFPSAADTTLRALTNRLRTASTEIGIIAFVASVWIGASFWGALDTAFCRIYHVDCRGWVEQKRFALLMLLVALLLVVATIGVPAAQSLLLAGASDLPFGLSDLRGVIVVGSVVLGLALLFVLLCVVYWAVPKAHMPWRGIWPGAIGATLAMGIVDYAFPFYLSHASAFATFGTTYVFIIIVLLWFYAMAIIMLSGAVINALRYELHDTGELSVLNGD